MCGMQFGDEGKGTFIDYVTHEKQADAIIRYNGDSQSSHTVITPEGRLHKFSQLGSGMFLDTCHTYITENMVVNLDNLMVELEFFSRTTGISIPKLIRKMHIHENCFVVTPYHKLLNRLRELSKGNKRRGSVGTGVSEVMYLLQEQEKNQLFPYERPLGLQVKDIYQKYTNNAIIGRLEALQSYVEKFYYQNQSAIWRNTPKEMKETIKKEIDYLLCPKAFFIIATDYVTNLKHAPKEYNLSQCIYTTYEQSIRKECVNTIWEGSQGLLIDREYGIKPNTTFLDTTNHFALSIAYRNDNVKKVGIAKAFTSRHGLGVFPTETEEVSSKVFDENQIESFWNGKIRFGWLDAVLLRYAQKINQVDELYLSCLDQLENFETIKICNAYLYHGKMEKEFAKLFDYEVMQEGTIRITDIKENGEHLSKYLQKCIPQYVEIPGWQEEIRNATSKEQLPEKCKMYISIIELLTGIPITVVSVGPTRENKIRVKS